MADPDPQIARPRIVIEGPLAERAQELVDREEYQTLEEVAEAAFEAFERDHAQWKDQVRRLIQEALDDSRPALPLDEAFADIRARIRARRAA
jgi:antitoxin ParD1/3/4